MTDAETPGPAGTQRPTPAAAPAQDAQPRPPRPPRTSAPAAAGPAPAPPAAEAEAPAERDCWWCHAGPGLFLLALAGALGYMGVDLMTGGRISQWLAGGGQDGGGDDRPA